MSLEWPIIDLWEVVHSLVGLFAQIKRRRGINTPAEILLRIGDELVLWTLHRKRVRHRQCCRVEHVGLLNVVLRRQKIGVLVAILEIRTGILSHLRAVMAGRRGLCTLLPPAFGLFFG